MKEPSSGENPQPEFLMPLPEGARIELYRGYFRIVNLPGHPLSSLKSHIPYHRYVLYEHSGRPTFSACVWCGYVMPWKTSLAGAQLIVVNVDHLDGNPLNNEPSNLAPACSWCNPNRAWAESYPEFWKQWRKWMRDVPPECRPRLSEIALDLGMPVTLPTRTLLPER